MSALDDLYEQIEKAGVTRMPTSTRLSLRFAERRGITTSTKRYFKVDEGADYDTSKKPTKQRVRLKGLTATQDNIHSGFRAQKNPSKRPISVYQGKNGKNVIMEGHHRSARAIARGDKTITAYVHRPPKIRKSALDALAAEIVKAGLIRPGKKPLLQRVGFLVSASKNERKAAIGRYLESRKRGLGFGPKGQRRARTGTYTGVYATGVNKSESSMDAIDALYSEIEKARGGPRSGMIPYGSRHQYGRAQFFEARAKRNGVALTDRQKRAKGFLAGRYRGSVKGPGGSVRRGVYKSTELPMSDAIDNLYEEIEKARGRGMVHGGSSRMLDRVNRTVARASSDTRRLHRDFVIGAKPKPGQASTVRRGHKLAEYLRDRRKGKWSSYRGRKMPFRREGKYS